MRRRLIIDGNAVYEIDEDCVREKKGKQQKEREKWQEDEGKDHKKAE